MKTLLVSLLCGLLIGWIIAAVHNSRSRRKDTDKDLVQDRISLLGGDANNNGALQQVELTSFERVEEFFANLDSASFEDLKQWILKEKDNRAIREIMVVVIKHLVAVNPREAFDFLIKDEHHRIYPDEVIKAWTKLDPMAAFEAVLERFPSGDFLYATVDHMESDDRQAVVEALLDRGFDVENPSRFMSVVESAVGSMSAEQYEAVYESLVAREMGEKHPKLFLSFLQNAAKANPESALTRAYDFALKHKDADIDYTYDEAFEESLFQWHEADPGRALEWGLKKLDPEGKGGFGFDKLDQNGDLPYGFMDSFLFAAIKHNGVNGLDRVWSLLGDDLRGRYAGGFEFPERELDKVREWMDENINSPELHARMLMSQMPTYAEAGRPEMVAEIVAQLDPDYEGLSGRVRTASHYWARTDAEGLREWISTVENSTARDAAIPELLRYWSENDPSRVEEFLQEHPDWLPESFLRDHLVHQKVGAVEFDELDSFVNALPDPFREEAIKRFAYERVQEFPEGILN